MSVLWKKTEFYNGESDREVIVIATGGIREGAEASSSGQVFPLWGPLPPIKIFPLPLKVLVLPIVAQTGTQNELILKGTFSACGVYIFLRICNSKTFNSLPSTEFLGECHQPTEQNLMENPGRSKKEPWLGFRKQNTLFLAF